MGASSLNRWRGLIITLFLLWVFAIGTPTAIAATPVAPTPQPLLDKDAQDTILPPAVWVQQNLEGGITNMLYRTAKAFYISMVGDGEGTPSHGGSGGGQTNPVELVFTTPPALTYMSQTVLSGRMVIRDLGLLLLLAVVGFVFLRSTALLGGPLAHLALSRLVGELGWLLIAAAALVFADTVAMWSINGINEVSSYFYNDGGSGVIGLLTLYNPGIVESSPAGLPLLPEYVVALALYSLSVGVLVAVMFLRILLLDLLLVFAPLGLFFLVLSATRTIGMLWASLFITLLIQQPIVVIYLRMAASIGLGQDLGPVVSLLVASMSLIGSLFLMFHLQRAVLSDIPNTGVLGGQ